MDEVHYLGVFGHFTDVVERRLDALHHEDDPLAHEKTRFFEHLLAMVDVARFERLQDAYIRSPGRRGFIKYLDPVTWFEHKFAFAHFLGLHERAPMRILDLGTGSGHFMVIARFYGHEVVGTDLPPAAKQDDAARAPPPFHATRKS